MAIKLNKVKNPLTKKAKKGFQGYPLATIAYYGPDNKKATKVAVGIILKEDEGAKIMEKWFSEKDLRRDIKINNEIKNFILKQGVKSVVMAPKILGCPHEEGIDYPMGESCPECPFWKNRDRFTDEIIH